jgi:hypothetical protein
MAAPMQVDQATPGDASESYNRPEDMRVPADNTVDGKLSWEIDSGDYADSLKRVYTLVSCKLKLTLRCLIADMQIRSWS